MKICCCSRSYARALQSGALTQLEWIDCCAELAIDGVDFAAAHFPRSDADYLAQLKKLCVDRGLTTAVLSADIPFGANDIDADVAGLASSIEMATAIGAPLVRFFCSSPAGSPAIAWRELIRGLKQVALTAKERNVSLALEPRAGTLVGSPIEVKRAFKECDSAWLRLGPSLALFDASADEDWGAVLTEAIVAVSDGSNIANGIAAARACGFIGFLTLETGGDDEDGALRSAYEAARRT